MREWRQPKPTRINEEPGWRYRYIRKDQVNRRLEEGNGWEIVKQQLMKDRPEAASMDGGTHYRGHVLMRIPLHIAEQRDQFYRDKHARRLAASAKASAMVEAGRRINAGQEGNLTGVIGKTVVQSVVHNDGMVVSKTTQSFDSQEVTQSDMEEVIEAKIEQSKDEQPISEAELQDKRESIPVKKRGRPKGRSS